MAQQRCPFVLLLRLLLNLMISAVSNGSDSVRTSFASIHFDPPYIHDLMAGTNTTVRMSVDLDTRHQQFAKLPPEKSFAVILKSTDKDIATVAKKRRNFTFDEYTSKANDLRTYEMNFTVVGHFLGKTTIKVRLMGGADENELDDDRSFYQISKDETANYESKNLLDVWVIQDSKRLVNRAFLTALVFLIVIANVLMGCELDINVVLETIKNPIAPLIGFCTQFIAMPLLAYGIANVIFTANGMHSFALGLFVTGCAPGGGASNYWTILLDGNLPVSVTMTFFSTLAALVMMPLWMWLLGFHFLRSFHPEAVIKVPYVKIITSLITMIVPLIFGIFLAYFKPAVRQRARKVMRPFIIFVLIFLIGFGTAANIYMIRLLTWTAVIGGLLLPWCGFSIGCFTAIFLRQPPPNVTAIAIETGIQNTGIAIMLLKFSFPDPDADISALIPVIAASMTPLPLLCIVAIHWAWKTLKKQGSKNPKSGDLEVSPVKFDSVVEKSIKDDDDSAAAAAAAVATTAVIYKIKEKDVEASPLMNDKMKQDVECKPSLL